MRIHLIRHGQSTANRDGIFQGQLDTELSELGKQQARQLQEKIPTDIDVIYSSPMIRALRTAEIATKELNLQIQVRDELREMNLGKIEGISKHEITEEQKIMWKKINSDYEYDEHEGETGTEMISRVREVFNEIVGAGIKNSYKEILVFSHYGVLKTIMNRIFDFDKRHFENATIYTIEKNGKDWNYISVD